MKTTPGGYIYLLSEETDKYLKIGIATNVIKRLSSIQTGNPYNISILYNVCVLNMRNAEKAFHKKFKHLKYKNEWFLKDESIITAFKTFSENTKETPVYRPHTASVDNPKVKEYLESLEKEYII